MLHNFRSRGSHTKESLRSGPSSMLLSVSLVRKVPRLVACRGRWPSSPNIWFRCPDWWCHIHHPGQRVWQGLLLTYLRSLGRAGQASQADLKGIERARKGEWAGLLLWLRSGARVARIGPCLVWISSQHQRRGHPAFLISFQMWAQGTEGGVRLRHSQQSKTSKKKTESNFLLYSTSFLFFKRSWLYCPLHFHIILQISISSSTKSPVRMFIRIALARYMS